VGRLHGPREFWSLSFALSPDTLEPRPDTETVVEAALAALPDRDAPLTMVDLGTGTGAILAALLSERPNAFGVGIDISAGAAHAARDNLARAGLASRSAVLVGSWGEALAGGFDLVVSNPPYIPSADIAGLSREVRLFDPARALDGGADGLAAYGAIASALPRLLAPGGTVVLELGIGQEAAVAALLRAQGIAPQGPAKLDLGGVPRALVGRKS
jgi:release factor glutamine methyltransferase